MHPSGSSRLVAKRTALFAVERAQGGWPGYLWRVQFSEQELEVLAEYRPASAMRWLEPKGNVCVLAVVDHGQRPAMGEVRFCRSDQGAVALQDACRLARGATIRNAVLGLKNAGAAAVVLADPALEHEVALALLRERLAEAEIRVVAGLGLSDAASSLGTDVAPAAPEDLLRLRGEVLDRCLQSLLSLDAQCTATIVDCGPVGRDAARLLVQRDVKVQVWDQDHARASAVATEIGAVASRTPWADAEVDLRVPCGHEPLIDSAVSERLRAKIVCGLAPRVFVDNAARSAAEARGVRVVPELLAALAEPLALAVAGDLLSEAVALTSIADTARGILASPHGAHERTVSVAIARSKAAAP